MRNTPPEVRVEAGGHALHVQAGPHAPDGSRDLGPTVPSRVAPFPLAQSQTPYSLENIYRRI